MALTLYGNSPVLMAYRDVSDQTISAGTSTTVLFNNVAYDTGSMYNPATGRVTPKIPGYYSIGAGIYFTNGTNVAFMQLDGYSNNAAFQHYGMYLGGSVNVVNSAAWPCVYMNGSTDFFQILGFTSNGGAFGVGRVHTWLQCALVRSTT